MRECIGKDSKNKSVYVGDSVFYHFTGSMYQICKGTYKTKDTAGFDVSHIGYYGLRNDGSTIPLGHALSGCTLLAPPSEKYHDYGCRWCGHLNDINAIVCDRCNGTYPVDYNE